MCSKPVSVANIVTFLPCGSWPRLSSPLTASSSCCYPPSNVSGSRYSLLRVQFSTQNANLSSDAQEAVSAILRENGLSNEESARIALNSPKYLSMLEDSVRDLDEWNAWSSIDVNNGATKLGFKELGYKEKFIYLARKKGDGGKLAVLESTGLSLNSAMNIARYLHDQPLPAVIEKVNYLKEMFFSDVDDGLTGTNARRMMMHFSIAPDEDLQRTLSFFEKIAAKRGGIGMLGSSDASLGYLLECFPHILISSVESHLNPLTEFFNSLGIPRHHTSRIILLFPPVMKLDIKELKERLQTFEKAASVDTKLGKILIRYPWVLSTSVQNNYKEILSFFDRKKVPREKVDEAIASFPCILGCTTAKLQVMVNQLGELNIRRKKLGKVIATSPQLLLQKPQEFMQVVSLLQNVGFSQESISRILARCPELFAADVEATLKRKLQFLASIGISETHMPRAIKKYPELLLSDVDSTLLPRVSFLMQLGISKRDVAFMIRRFSPLLGYSIEAVLKPKTEFFMNTMRKPLSEIVNYPRYYSYSLEKKIKPRFWVLKSRKIDCTLKDMLDKNDEEFAANFLHPQEAST